MSQALPLAHRRLRLTQVLGSDAMERYQQIVVGAQLDVVANRRRSIEHDRGKVFAVRCVQVFQKTLQTFLDTRFNHRVLCS